MKHFISLLLLMIVLLFSIEGKAGILVPKHENSAVVGASGSGLSAMREIKTSFNTHPTLAKRCRRGNSALGWVTVGAAIAGLFIPGLSILAILLGILGMTRGCRADRLATAGGVIGLAELVVFLLTSSAVYALL